MHYHAISLLLFAVLATSNAFYTLIPNGKEVTYHYHGLVKAGTMEPAFFSSAFVLDGKIHIQSQENSTFMKFSDLKYKMYNGKYDEWHEFDGKLIELPVEMDDLNNVFRVAYDTAGKAMGIATEINEKQYIVNIKRGIANIMQLDIGQIHLDSQKAHTFQTTENNLYGKGSVYYNVRPTNGRVFVEKMDEYHSTKHLYIHTIKNVDYDYCAAIYDEPTTRDSQKMYTFIKKDNQDVIEYVEATGGVYYHTYAGHTDANYIYLNQSFNLISVQPVQTTFKLNSEKYYNRLMYYVSDMENITGPIPDISNGRRHFDMDKMLTITEEMIHGVVTYIRKDNIRQEQPDIKEGQLPNRLMRIGLYLDLTTLKKIHNNLIKSTNEDAKLHLQIYYHMLATLGTHASYYQIKSLIEEKIVQDYVAISMLSNMPSNIKHPNKKIMDDMSAIIYWGKEINKSVRKAALLSYGTMLQKANDRYHRYRFTNIWDNHAHEHFEDHRDDLSLEESYPNEKYYEKHIMELVNRIKTSEDYDMVLTCLEALHNSKMESVMNLLIPAVKGEWWDDNHLKMSAAIAIGPMIAKHKELVYDVYWPIMINPNFSTTFRIVAYTLIMESQPSLSRLSNIYWEMQAVTDSTLYLYHYRYMTTLAKTTDPCKKMFKTHLNQILQYSSKPDFKGLTGYYQIDYNNALYGTGQGMQWMFVQAPREGEIIFTSSIFNYRDNYLPTTPLSLLVRIDGLKQPIFDELKLDLTDSNMMFTYKKFFKIFDKMSQLDSIKISISVARYKQVIMSYHFDKTNIKTIAEVFDILNKQYSSLHTYLDFYFPISKTIIIPSDMGFPILFQQYVPDLHYIDYGIKKESINELINFNVDIKIKKWSHAREGIAFYNSFVDVWQGVSKYRTYDTAMVLYFDLSLNLQKQSFKISWKRHENQEDDVMGERMYTASMVFVKDDMHNDALKKSSEQCNNFELVSHGKEYRHDYINTDFDIMLSRFAEYGSELANFDSERYMPSNSLSGPELNAYNKFQESILKYLHWHLMEYIQPFPHITGYILRFESSQDRNISSIDIDVHYNAEYKKGSMLLLPASKQYYGLTITYKINETISRGIDFNAIRETNVGHTDNSLILKVSSIISNERRLVLCIDGTDKWDENGLKTNTTLTISTPEGKCEKENYVADVAFSIGNFEDELRNESIYRQYSTCRERIWGYIHEQQTLECYIDRASLRSYELDIKLNEGIKEKDQAISWILRTFIKYYSKYYRADFPLKFSSTNHVTDNEVNMNWAYYKGTGVLYLTINTPKEDHYFENIPENEWIVKTSDFNMMYNKLYLFMHSVGLTKTCVASSREIVNIKEEIIEFALPVEWTMVLGDSEKDCQHGVWAKKIDNSIAVKFVHNTHTLEIIPIGEKYEFFEDGKQLTDDSCIQPDKWYHYQWVNNTNAVSIVTNHLGLYALYDGHNLQVEYPNSEIVLHGHCLDEV